MHHKMKLKTLLLVNTLPTPSPRPQVQASSETLSILLSLHRAWLILRHCSRYRRRRNLPAMRNFLRQKEQDLQGKEKHLQQKEQDLRAEKLRLPSRSPTLKIAWTSKNAHALPEDTYTCLQIPTRRGRSPDRGRSVGSRSSHNWMNWSRIWPGSAVSWTMLRLT